MKFLFKALFVTGTLTILFWYFELASPGQKRTLNIYKDEVAGKAKDVGAAVVDKSKEIYEDRDKYIDKAGEVAESVSEKASEFIDKHYTSDNDQDDKESF